MNIRYILYLCSRIFFVLAILMVLPILVSLVCEDGCVWAFLIPALVLCVLGILSGIQKPAKGTLFAKEGFAVVTIVWIVFAVFGAVPFMISGVIPRFADAFFETVSGFTTTGSTVLADVESLPRSILFWRQFTNWIGGMGVLAFALAILPLDAVNKAKGGQAAGSDVYIIRAESPGPMFGKLVPKLRFNVQILYIIYAILTVLEILLLLIGGMDLFDAVCHSFSSAGTGGFSTRNISIGAYDSAYIDTVIGIFILLFGVNFNIFYFLLTKNFLGILKSDELRWYLIIVASAVLMITFDIRAIYGDFFISLRYAFFQVASIITTTGFSSVDFNLWSSFSKGILVLLMFIGACASSTGGGLKVSRIIILVKTAVKEIRYYLNPREIRAIRCDGSHVPHSVVTGVSAYFAVYMLIFAGSTILLSLFEHGQSLETCFTAVAACLNNIGPGLDGVGPMENFGFMKDISKYLLSFDMLLGRLELFPILALFSKAAWRH
ncbi:MAG: TrkH family potassium uptake protein [Ruminococcaceae bacterium]|nr:TrkH family potassium uptake protein [Oscillospiraceae bacterium]